MESSRPITPAIDAPTLLGKLEKIETKINEIAATAQLLQNPAIIQMDTCDKLISEESYRYFTGDIKDDYLRLIKNLDESSIQTVVRILSRIHNYRKEKTSYFWFTEFEKQELTKILDKHGSSILKLSDGCYAYGKYLLPRDIITTSIFYYDHFLGEVENVMSTRNREIIDVGGFIGDSSLILSKYTDKYVHVFEPVTELYELTKKTVELNELQNIVVNKLALGAKSETRRMNLAGDTSTLCAAETYNEHVCVQEEVEIITLDEYVATRNLDVGLIKVDIEGFEQYFLRGAVNTIKAQKPILLLSIYHNAHDFFYIKTMIEEWNLGYKFKIRKPSDTSILVDTTLIAEIR